MTSSERSADGDSSALQGFQAYADDSPRGAETPANPLVDDRWDDGGDASDTDVVPSRRRHWAGVGVVAGGAALALVAGALLARDEGASAVPAPAPVIGQAARMNIQVVPAAETISLPPPPTGPKLEVLPPPPRATALVMPQRTPLSPRAFQPPRPLEPAGRQRESSVAPSGQDVAALALSPRPSFACSDALTLARAMVCGDRRLAILDQRMKQAYAAALAAGAPEDLLREDQEDWLNVREDAAQDSRDAVAAVYHQRIAELRETAGDDF